MADINSIKSYGIILLCILVICQFAWGRHSNKEAEEEYLSELATVVEEGKEIQAHADGLHSRWATLSADHENLQLENERLEELAGELDLEVEQKNRLILRQKTIIEDLEGQVTTIVDSTTGVTQDKVSFQLHRNGVRVSGFTLNPPGTAHLEIEHDPIKLDIHIARTASGAFRKGLLDAPPWMNIESWDIILDDEFSDNASIWQKFKKSLTLEVGAIVGPGGNGIPVTLGALGWNGGVVATEEGISYMVTKTFHPFQRE